MKKKAQDERDSELRMLFNKVGVEKPSAEFTDTVMEIVRNEQIRDAEPYKPVINKRGWILISTIVGLLGILVVFINPPQFSWWPSIQFSNLHIPDLLNNNSDHLFGDLIQFQKPTLILIAVVAFITLILCDFLIYKFREKEFFGIL
jgi:H+/Cl- antiporter ClcA